MRTSTVMPNCSGGRGGIQSGLHPAGSKGVVFIEHDPVIDHGRPIE
ncbi:hypothetical protein [Photobacterium indicum]